MTVPWWHKLMSSSIAGGFGGYICFPWEGLKKQKQRGQPITMKSFYPTELMRGSTGFATSVTVATMASMTFNNLLHGLPGYDPTSHVCIVSAAVGAGMIGAIVGSTPVENLIAKQQELKTGPVQAMRHMLQQGITRPWVGVRELAIREGGFAFSMLVGGRAANKAAYEQTQSKMLGNVAEGGACALGAAITHPWDRIATYRQIRDGKISLSQAIREINRQGWKGFFPGLEHRVVLFWGCAALIPRIEEIISRTILNNGAFYDRSY
jgi:hypothetical protein